MKRSLAVTGLLLSLFILGSAQKTALAPNFAGTWQLDTSRTQLPEMRTGTNRGPRAGMTGPHGLITGQTLTVTQDAKTLTVVVDTKTDAGVAEASQTSTYNVDGTETTTEISFGPGTIPAKLSMKFFEKKKVALSSIATTDSVLGKVTISVKSVWELVDNGKTLKVHRTQETPRGVVESDWVYVKN